jgi:hypothetical protein
LNFAIDRVGSGFPFPLPWSKLPENVYLMFRIIYAMVYMPELSAKRAFLQENGIADPLRFYALHREDTPWFSQHTEGAARPVDFIPPNVTCTGPMSVSLGSAKDQDPALLEWLTRAPTVLVNMGSNYIWPERQATAMAKAIGSLLETTDLQFIWKLKSDESPTMNVLLSDQFETIVKPLLESGRLKIERWLTVDPTALLETGHIVASVHHGGAGNYHEAIGYVPTNDEPCRLSPLAGNLRKHFMKQQLTRHD